MSLWTSVNLHRSIRNAFCGELYIRPSPSAYLYFRCLAAFSESSDSFLMFGGIQGQVSGKK